MEKELEISRSTIKKVIKNFEKDNTIWGYSPIVDVTKLGKKVYMILFKIKPSMYKNFKKVFKHADINVNNPNNDIYFISSGYTQGHYDFYMKVIAEDIVTVKFYVDNVVSDYSTDIESYEILRELLPIRKCGKVNPELKHKIDILLPK